MSWVLTMRGKNEEDLLNLRTLQQVGVAGEGSASVAGVGKVGDGRGDAVHEGDGDDLTGVSLGIYDGDALILRQCWYLLQVVS